MSDRPNCIFEDSAGLRESFLQEIPADRRPILRELTDWILELSREAQMVEIPDEPNREHMAAVGADLRHCASALYMIAWHGTEAGTDPGSLRLVVLAGDLAPQVEALARDIETALLPS
ncbi:MAG: hypothetical protein AAF604_04380 [Acidobacteriota bacterium]